MVLVELGIYVPNRMIKDGCSLTVKLMQIKNTLGIKKMQGQSEAAVKVFVCGYKILLWN